jgi:hypothetical protein
VQDFADTPGVMLARGCRTDRDLVATPPGRLGASAVDDPTGRPRTVRLPGAIDEPAWRLPVCLGDATSMSRRRFLIQGAATVGGALILTSDEAAATPTLPTYALDPEWGAASPDCPTEESARGRGCHACAACHAHAANRLFASTAAADAGRAHPGCRCLVVAATHLPYDTWVGLFGLPEAVVRPSVDRRVSWVHDLLAAASHAPTPVSAPQKRNADAERAPARSAAAPFRVTCFRVGRMGRELLLQVDVRGSALAGVRLLAPRGESVVSRSLSLSTGRNLARIRLSRRLPPGRYGVELSVPAAGRTLRRPFVIRR